MRTRHSMRVAAMLSWAVVNCAAAAHVGILLSGADHSIQNQVAATSVMACKHVQQRVSAIVPAAVALPDDFNFNCSFAVIGNSASKGVSQTAEWNEKGVDVIIGAHWSSISGPVSLVAAVSHTPVISYWATAPSLSDKNVYAFFGRTIPHDEFTTNALVNTISSMGWKALALLYPDNTFGQGFAQGVARYASDENVQVLASQKYFPGDSQSIKEALEVIKRSGARIIVPILVYTVKDLVTLAEIADNLGIARKGYVWVVPEELYPDLAVKESANPEATWEILSGWLQVTLAPFGESRGERFQATWKAHSIEYITPPLPINVSSASSGLVNEEDCSVVCGWMYDAVWAAAMTVNEAPKNADGSVDKTALTETMRGLSFLGATGTVSFDQNLDRHAGGVAVSVRNWQPYKTAQGQLRLDTVEIAMWQEGQNLSTIEGAEPFWQGGGRGWASVPQDGWTCRQGEVYSNSLLACQQCPAGTMQVVQECVPCRPGTYAPDQGMTQCLPCGQTGFANESGMPRCSVCPSNYEIPISVNASVSQDDCVCKEGYFRGCKWQIWQVVALASGLLLLAHAAFHLRQRWQKRKGGEEEGKILHRIQAIRSVLLIRREDGWLLPGESRTWRQRLFLSELRPLKASSLDNLARLTLMLKFDPEAIDYLSSTFRLLETGERLSDALLSSKADIAGMDEGGPWHRLCRFVIQMSLQLLDPDYRGPDNALGRARSETSIRSAVLRRGQSGSFSTTVNDRVESFIPAESASERFDFFVDNVAKLELWDQEDNFRNLKLEIQSLVDNLRFAMDSVYSDIVKEEGGLDLVQFQGPSALSQGDTVRQDDPKVEAIRVDRTAKVEMELQQQASSRQLRVPSQTGATLAESDEIAPALLEVSAGHCEPTVLLDTPPVLAVTVDDQDDTTGEDQGTQFWRVPTATRCGQGAATSEGQRTPAMSRSRSPPIRRQGSTDTTGSLMWQSTRRVPSVESQASSIPPSPCKSRRHGEDVSFRCIDERQFINQLYLRSQLLDEGFQAQIRAACALQVPELIIKRRESHTSLQSEFGGLNREIGTNACPVLQVKEGPPKTVRRMTDKVNGYAEEALGGLRHRLPFTALILDPVRTCLICENPSVILQAARWFIDNEAKSGLPVVRVKNKFAIKDSSEVDGYRDLMLSVHFTGVRGLSIIGEIQLHDARMYPLKVRMHRLYKVKRATAASSIG